MVAVSDTTEGKKSTDILVKTFIAGGTELYR